MRVARSVRPSSVAPTTRKLSAFIAAAAVLVALLVGCSSAGAPDEQSSSLGVPPPARRDTTTMLEASTVSGSLKVGSFTAVPGDLWIRGRCAGGTLELHIEPLAVLPIDCTRLGDVPFQNQITLRHGRDISLTVVAPLSVTWGVRVEQDQRNRSGGSPSPS